MGDKTRVISVIDRGLTINGVLVSTGRLIIKGTVKGTIRGETVIVAREGSVYADIDAASMIVGGLFEGELHISHTLSVLATGSCTGKVICKDLVVEVGGILNADITCETAQPATSRSKVVPPAADT